MKQKPFVLNFLQISYIHSSHLCSHSNVPLSFPNVEPSVFWSTEMTANPNQHWGGENHTSVSRFVTSIVDKSTTLATPLCKNASYAPEVHIRFAAYRTTLQQKTEKANWKQAAYLITARCRTTGEVDKYRFDWPGPETWLLFLRVEYLFFRPHARPWWAQDLQVEKEIILRWFPWKF